MTFVDPVGVAALTVAVLLNFEKYVNLLRRLRRNARIWWLFLLCFLFGYRRDFGPPAAPIRVFCKRAINGSHAA